MKLTVKELLAIVEKDNHPVRFWVDADGKKHTISGSVSSKIVGGFEKTTTGRRRYQPGEALYYKV